MSKWPVETPIDPDPPAINLAGAPPDPSTFDGPLNEFIELHGTAVANNTATQTMKDYDTLHPPVARAEGTPSPSTPLLPPPPPTPRPVSAGRPIAFDTEKYVIEYRKKRR